ncbi:MAG: FYDLN acid domain-containing protein [Rhodospirillales bacterium]
MAKPEWGLKRACRGCGERYYDLLRTPPICPHCGVEFVAEPIGRRRPQATTPLPVPKAIAAPAPKAGTDADDSGDDDDDDGDDASLIESADDLSGDDEDVTEVKEHIETDVVDKST